MTVASAVAPTEFSFLRELVESKAGIVLEADKSYLVEARLMPLVEREKLGSIGALIQRLRADLRLTRLVIEAFTTNETSFFRDNAPFQTLKAQVLPALERRTDRVRIWSAACSTGQEAYSLAMLAKDEFPGLVNRIEIVGTDLNEAVVAKARNGRYSQLEVNRGLPAQALVRHFARQGMEWQIATSIRAMAQFRVQNLLEPWPATAPFDVVLLRNILIYFSLETRARLLKRIHGAIRPGGWLLLGSSENTMVPSDLFEVEFHGPICLFRPR